jgi:hypothetical protein
MNYGDDSEIERERANANNSERATVREVSTPVSSGVGRMLPIIALVHIST